LILSDLDLKHWFQRKLFLVRSVLNIKLDFNEFDWRYFFIVIGQIRYVPSLKTLNFIPVLTDIKYYRFVQYLNSHRILFLLFNVWMAAAMKNSSGQWYQSESVKIRNLISIRFESIKTVPIRIGILKDTNRYFKL